MFRGISEDCAYELRPSGLARLIVPSLFGAIGTGIFFGYFSDIVLPGTLMNVLFASRYQVILLMFLWLLFMYCMFYMVDQNSFTKRCLSFKNVFSVWCIFLFCWTAVFLFGTEVYTHVVAQYFMITI